MFGGSALASFLVAGVRRAYCPAMRTLTIAFAAAIALGASAGCLTSSPTDCAAEWRSASGFSLFVNETPGLADGLYHWTVTADGVTRTRDVTVTKGRGVCACGITTDPAGSQKAAELYVTMDANSASLVLFDDPAGGGRQSGPPHIDLAITRADGRLVGSFTFDPSYHLVSDDCQSVLRSQYVVSVVGP